MYSYKFQLITESDFKNFLQHFPKQLQDIVNPSSYEGISYTNF